MWGQGFRVWGLGFRVWGLGFTLGVMQEFFPEELGFAGVGVRELFVHLCAYR